MRKCIFLLVLFLVDLQGPTLWAQDIPIGTWRNHLSYQSARQIAILPDEVYCASANGLFSWDRASGSLNTLSKLEGLSENTVQEIAYDAATQTLLIAYANSNIDLIQGNEIIELPLLKNADVRTSKTIRHIYFDNRLAYLSSDLGLVILDLDKLEIRETLQNLGVGGAALSIFSATVSRDSLLLATQEGVIIASLRDNLQDFNNWRRFSDPEGLAGVPIREIASLNNNVYVAVDQLGMYKYQHQNAWELRFPDASRNYNDLKSTRNQLLVSSDDGTIQTIDNQEIIRNTTDPLFTNPQEAGLDAQGNLWVADPIHGLVGNVQGAFQSFFPNGPARSESWSLNFSQGSVYAFSGGFDATYEALNRNAGFYVFRENSWENFNAFDTQNATSIPAVNDLIQGVVNPADQRLFISSYGQGLLIRDPEGNVQLIDQNTPGSPLETDPEGNVRLTGLARDFNNALWIANHSLTSNQNSLHVLKADGSWMSFPSPSFSGRNPLDILIDNNGYKWVRLSPNRGGGIWVLDDVGNRTRLLSSGGNNGNLPNSNVNSIALDLDGQIWIGTDEGVAVIFEPFAIFEPNVNALTPIFEFRPLLRAEKVNVIAVDGGNQKWIGTDNGLWLFNPDGSELLERFREENSPLISNVILDLIINPTSGELFIATDKGIVSYRGGATSGQSTFENVRVFPNPVRPDFTGMVGISGLVENANVKITDISGRLFFEGEARGGTLAWNLRDYNGVRAKTGVYLILSTNADGSETLVTKIAVVE